MTMNRFLDSGFAALRRPGMTRYFGPPATPAGFLVTKRRPLFVRRRGVYVARETNPFLQVTRQGHGPHERQLHALSDLRRRHRRPDYRLRAGAKGLAGAGIRAVARISR